MRSLLAVTVIFMCCKCMCISNAIDGQGHPSHRLQATICFNLSRLYNDFNYTEVRSGNNVYIEITRNKFQRRVYVQQANGFTFVTAYDPEYEHLSVQRPILQFRPLSFAINLAFDLHFSNRSDFNPDLLANITANGLDVEMHFNQFNSTEMVDLGRLSMISHSGFQLQLKVDHFEQNIHVDESLFKTDAVYCNFFRDQSKAQNLTLKEVEHRWRVELTRPQFDYILGEQRVLDGNIIPYNLFNARSI